MAKFVEKNTFLTNEKFFVNFSKNASKQQKSLVELFMAQFDEKNIFLTEMTSFLSIYVKMLQYNRKS